MTDDLNQTRLAADEAAGWYAKMNGDGVSNADVRDFFAWRAKDHNDKAYSRLEKLAGLTRELSGSPELQAMANAALSRNKAGAVRLLGSRPRMAPIIAGGLLVAAGITASLMAPKYLGQVYDTPVGEQRTVALDDGSRIELNTDSRVRVRFSAGTRSLTLERGQALFEVAHDTARPFIVKAGAASVRAVGTKFEVYRRAADVRVTLVEGKVEVTGTLQGQVATPLVAGQGVEVRRATITPPVKVDTAAVTGWTQGRLTFHDARLADAVAEVNRYSRSKVVLAANAPVDERINGAFDTGDPKAFANGVAALLDLKARPKGGDIELSRGAVPPPS